MIGIIHGYLLEGSGSNLWTRSMARAMVQNGKTVHLICQENHPEIYDFISEAMIHYPDGHSQQLFKRDVPYPGKCILHRPYIGEVLPVYVWDQYEHFQRVIPLVEISDGDLNRYLQVNFEILKNILDEFPINIFHVNHAVPLSAVAAQLQKEKGIPFVIMPHGSAIEYAVKKDVRYEKMARAAFTAANGIVVVGEEMRQRVLQLFPHIPNLSRKLIELPLGVDTSLFKPTPPEKRPEQIQKLVQQLKSLASGRSLKQNQQLIKLFQSHRSWNELIPEIRQLQQYESKKPDASLIQRLEAIDWRKEKILLFVGRLISSKGAQSVLAGLPFILAAQPDTRFIITGHGPLREILELFVYALHQGRKDLLADIIYHGHEFEGENAAPWENVQYFWKQLEADGQMSEYLKAAKNWVNPSKVVFTGYLTHNELNYLFPCADVAIFPSIVREAGPLVFLEALASGCFPVGTYFGGMKASIDMVSKHLPSRVAELMKLGPQPDRTVQDIVAKVPIALEITAPYRDELRTIAVENFDWTGIARRYSDILEMMAANK